jgi:hypothetical protein
VAALIIQQGVSHMLGLFVVLAGSIFSPPAAQMVHFKTTPVSRWQNEPKLKLETTSMGATLLINSNKQALYHVS